MSIAHKIEDKARTNDVILNEDVNFSSLLLSENVLAGLNNEGFVNPSPIQLKAIPLGRCGLDLIVQAKSGTGKTCVFAVVALESVEVTSICIQALVLAPTREIAQQIQSVIKGLGSVMTSLQCHTFIGGMPYLLDKMLVKNCHIAVGTPGRVKQLIQQGEMSTKNIRLFVLDEADKLLEAGFQEDINWIYSCLPTNKQIMALSATYPESLANQLTSYMRNPTFVRLNSNDPALLGIKQYYTTVESHALPNVAFDKKVQMVVKILSSVIFQQCLIFSNMQNRALNLQSELQAQNWPTHCIAGCLNQKERTFAMEQLKSYRCRILISTDLTSRGIDADKVNLVINLDVPKEHETYLHRIGRAGRFGSYGAAVTIVSAGEQEKDLRTVEKKCHTRIQKLPDPIPNDLVTKALKVRADDVVSTQKIITDESLNNETDKSSKSDNYEKEIHKSDNEYELINSTIPTSAINANTDEKHDKNVEINDCNVYTDSKNTSQFYESIEDNTNLPKNMDSEIETSTSSENININANCYNHRNHSNNATDSSVNPISFKLNCSNSQVVFTKCEDEEISKEFERDCRVHDDEVHVSTFHETEKRDYLDNENVETNINKTNTSVNIKTINEKEIKSHLKTNSDNYITGCTLGDLERKKDYAEDLSVRIVEEAMAESSTSFSSQVLTTEPEEDVNLVNRSEKVIGLDNSGTYDIQNSDDSSQQDINDAQKVIDLENSGTCNFQSSESSQLNIKDTDEPIETLVSKSDVAESDNKSDSSINLAFRDSQKTETCTQSKVEEVIDQPENKDTKTEINTGNEEKNHLSGEFNRSTADFENEKVDNLSVNLSKPDSTPESNKIDCSRDSMNAERSVGSLTLSGGTSDTKQENSELIVQKIEDANIKSKAYSSEERQYKRKLRGLRTFGMADFLSTLTQDFNAKEENSEMENCDENDIMTVENGNIKNVKNEKEKICEESDSNKTQSAASNTANVNSKNNFFQWESSLFYGKNIISKSLNIEKSIKMCQEFHKNYKPNSDEKLESIETFTKVLSLLPSPDSEEESLELDTLIQQEKNTRSQIIEDLKEKIKSANLLLNTPDLDASGADINSSQSVEEDDSVNTETPQSENISVEKVLDVATNQTEVEEPIHPNLCKRKIEEKQKEIQIDSDLPRKERPVLKASKRKSTLNSDKALKSRENCLTQSGSNILTSDVESTKSNDNVVAEKLTKPVSVKVSRDKIVANSLDQMHEEMLRKRKELKKQKELLSKTEANHQNESIESKSSNKEKELDEIKGFSENSHTVSNSPEHLDSVKKESLPQAPKTQINGIAHNDTKNRKELTDIKTDTSKHLPNNDIENTNVQQELSETDPKSNYDKSNEKSLGNNDNIISGNASNMKEVKDKPKEIQILNSNQHKLDLKYVGKMSAIPNKIPESLPKSFGRKAGIVVSLSSSDQSTDSSSELSETSDEGLALKNKYTHNYGISDDPPRYRISRNKNLLSQMASEDSSDPKLIRYEMQKKLKNLNVNPTPDSENDDSSDSETEYSSESDQDESITDHNQLPLNQNIYSSPYQYGYPVPFYGYFPIHPQVSAPPPMLYPQLPPLPYVYPPYPQVYNYPLPQYNTPYFGQPYPNPYYQYQQHPNCHPPSPWGYSQYPNFYLPPSYQQPTPSVSIPDSNSTHSLNTSQSHSCSRIAKNQKEYVDKMARFLSRRHRKS